VREEKEKEEEEEVGEGGKEESRQFGPSPARPYLSEKRRQ
jgi:hypothetical protein